MENLNKDEYNSQPVLYCKRCLSLKILNISSMEDSDYCDDCGSPDIGECSISEWEEKYKNKYGHKYLEEY